MQNSDAAARRLYQMLIAPGGITTAKREILTLAAALTVVENGKRFGARVDVMIESIAVQLSIARRRRWRNRRGWTLATGAYRVKGPQP